MRRFCTFLLLIGLSGCGLMEDMILGPEPPPNQPGQAPPTGSCNAPPPAVRQTGEPEILQVRK